MSGEATAAPVHLLVYAFEPGSQFEGELMGALERLESGGALRILEASARRSSRASRWPR